MICLRQGTGLRRLVDEFRISSAIQLIRPTWWTDTFEFETIEVVWNNCGHVAQVEECVESESPIGPDGVGPVDAKRPRKLCRIVDRMAQTLQAIPESNV